MGKKLTKRQRSHALINSRRNIRGTSEGTSDAGEDQSMENAQKIFLKISDCLPFDKWQMFGIRLRLDMNTIMELERERSVHNYERDFVIYRMLEKWKDKTNPDEGRLVSLLVEALRKIKCNHIADAIKTEYHQESSRNDSAIQKELEDKLKTKYGALQLPRFLWLRNKVLPLDQLFVEPSMKMKDKWGEEEDKKIDKENIFIEEDNKILRRILIEGHPGYGKTTLLAKLLSDCSRGEKYICDRFDLVLVIPLRNYGGNLSLLVLQLCEEVKGSHQEKLKAIEAIEDKVLLLLDGLDEIPTGAMETLLPLLRGKEHSKMTVVVTCRTGFAQLKTEPDQVLGNMNISDSAEPCIWDRRVQIKGISHGKRQEFLQKYLNVNDEELNEKVSRTNLELSDLYECPLLLLLLAVFVQEKDVRPIKTKTDLYKTIFNFVINRSLEKDEKQKGQKIELDVFDLKRKSDKLGIRHLLINFGQLCLEKLKTQSLTFEESELLKCSDGNGDLILKLGFLSKKISFFNYEEKEHYEPIHISFLEFLAAFFLSSSDEIENEIQDLMFKFNMLPNNDQLFYVFLGGFLQSNAFKLFNAFSPYNGIISIFNDEKNYLYNVQNILLEVPDSKQIINSLESLSVGNWQRVRYEESIHRWFVGFLKYSKKRSDISLLIPKHLDIFNNLSNDIKIKTVQVNISKNEKFKIRVRNVQCENLIFTIEDGIYKNSQKILQEIISKVKAEKTWLKVSYPFWQEMLGFNPRENFIKFFTELIGKRFQHFNFSYLSLNDIPPSLFSSVSPSIHKLIKNQKIHYGVNIQLSKEIENHLDDSFRKEFINFEKIVCASELKSFGVDNPNCKNPLSFPEMFYNDEKEMKYIGMRGSFEGIKMDKVKSFSAEQFLCIELELEKKSFASELLLRIKNSKRLACESDLISDLSSYPFISKWKGLKSIHQLDLDVGKLPDKDSGKFLKVISLFNNLQEINLIGLKNQKLLIDVISHLPSLKRICYSSESNFLKKFLKELLSLQDQNNREFNFDELEVRIVLEADDISNFLSNTCIRRVKKCLVNHVLNKFSIIHGSTLHLENLLKYFISKKKFKISSQWIEEPRHHGISDLVLSELNLDETPQLKHRQSIYVENF